MSLKTWKQEFYPCNANSREAKKDPIGHSLRKWEGLLKKNIKKHDLRLYGLTLMDEHHQSIEIDSSSCSLCRKYHNEKAGFGLACASCPIVKATGHDCISAYAFYWRDENPRPMVNLLRKTKKFAEKEKANG